MHVSSLRCVAVLLVVSAQLSIGEDDVDASLSPTADAEQAEEEQINEPPAEVETAAAVEEEAEEEQINEPPAEVETAAAVEEEEIQQETPAADQNEEDLRIEAPTTTTTTTTIARIYYTGDLPDIPVLGHGITDEMIDEWSNLEMLSLERAGYSYHEKGAWMYGDHKSSMPKIKHAVRCAEACEDDTRCRHWNFNVVTRRCALMRHGKPGAGSVDTDKRDWICGHGSRHPQPDEQEEL